MIGNRINSFTVIDLLAGLVITTLIISWVFQLFINLNTYVTSVTNSSLKLTKFQLANIELERVFYHSGEYLIEEEDGLYDKKRKIKYSLINKFLLREDSLTIDTLLREVVTAELMMSTTKVGDSKIEGLLIELNLLKNQLKLKYEVRKNNAQIINNKLIYEF